MASMLYYLAEAWWMMLVQFFLLKAQHFHQTNPRNRPLTSFEKCIIGTAFWIFFQLGCSAIGLIISFSKTVIMSTDIQHPSAGNTNQTQSASGTGRFVYKVLATWLIHKAINFVLETVLPFWEEMACDSERARLKFEARVSELLEGIQDFVQGRGFGHNRVQVIRGSGHEISLERHQVNNPMEGQRTLDWNIVVDKTALDEMKETLGPPGGFGEMGFNVSKDGVSFEAMGVGTRFNLRFSLKAPPIPRVELETKRRPPLKGRSNTK
jgi:hypothetical protein